MDKLTIGFIIRFYYSENDPKFEHRYKHFKDNVLPKINNQIYKDFDIYIWSNPVHREMFLALGCKIITAPDKRFYNSRGFYQDKLEYNELEGLPMLDVQLGLDSDDYIEPAYVEVVVKEIKKHNKIFPKQSLHLCFLPRFYDLKTNTWHKSPRYSLIRGSAFMALYQPIKTKYRYIYHTDHTSIITYADRKKILPMGYCCAIMHYHNETTGKSLEEREKNKSILV